MDGVGTLKVGSIMGVINQALFWGGLLLFILVFEALTSATTTGTSVVYPGWITVNTIYIMLGMILGGAAISIICYIFFFLGFRKVKQVAPEFGSVVILMIIGLIGFIMIVGGFGLIIGTLVNAIANASSSTTVSLGALLAGVALIGFGGLLSFIGAIGMCLGNWRAGKRYDESMTKIGGILVILPFVSIIGYVLCLVGYSAAGKKLAQGWQPASPYMAPAMMAQGGYPPMAGQPQPGYYQGAPAAGYGQPSPAYSQPAQTYAQPTQTYAASPAPASPTPSGAPLCQMCGKPTTFVPQYNRYYCYSCKQYA
jgi:hypothetical protein